MRKYYRERVDEGGEFADAIEQEALIQRLYAAENATFKKYRQILSILFILQVTIINLTLRKQYPGTTLLAVFSIILTAAHLNLDFEQLVDSGTSNPIVRIVFNPYFYHSVNFFVCTRLVFKVLIGGTPLTGLYFLPMIDLVIGISLQYWNIGKRHDIGLLKQLKSD